MYTHLTRDDRATLASLWRSGERKTFIAKKIGVCRSTITRELRRNTDEDGTYRALSAHRQTKKRRLTAKEPARILEHDAPRVVLVESKLKLRSSPEQIAYTTQTVSTTTIYAWLERSRPELKCHLRRRGKRRRKYGTKREKRAIQQAKMRSIDERPEEVETRDSVGHWEGDTVREKDGVFLTHVERMSGFGVADKLERGLADLVHEKVKARFSGTLPCLSITYDRGSEFALHDMIERDTHACVYFAHAYHAWERGTNEN